MTRFTPVAFAFAFAFAIGLSLAGAAASNPRIVEIVWSADGRFEHRAPVAAGSFVELCGKLAGGQAVRWRSASAPTPSSSARLKTTAGCGATRVPCRCSSR